MKFVRVCTHSSDVPLPIKDCLRLMCTLPVICTVASRQARSLQSWQSQLDIRAANTIGRRAFARTATRLYKNKLRGPLWNYCTDTTRTNFVKPLRVKRGIIPATMARPPMLPSSPSGGRGSGHYCCSSTAVQNLLIVMTTEELLSTLQPFMQPAKLWAYPTQLFYC